jgi:glycerophosphoryl diester phosphodiesterase
MPQTSSTPEIIAHRGVRDRYPENSLPAFQSALEEGADAIELDVHGTSDGVLVVHHDDRLPVVPNSTLSGRAIAAIPSSELEPFELAPGIGIPTLDEALDAVMPRAGAYIEIKAPNIEASLADALARRRESRERCAVHSFDHRTVRRFGLIAPNIPTGILLAGYPVDSPSLLRAAHARDFWLTCEFIDRDLVDAIHAARGRVIAWTCNDAPEWSRLATLGVDGICTDRTSACVAWAKDR